MHRRFSFAFALSAALAASTALADDRGYPAALPSFSLLDPTGTSWDQDDVLGQGVILVVTAPTIEQEDAQEGWSECLCEESGDGDPRKILFVEDMDQALIAPLAEEAIRSAYEEGSRVIPLLDHQGALRKSLGVGEGATVVLVYDARGCLVFFDEREPSAEGARRAWAALGEVSAEAGGN